MCEGGPNGEKNACKVDLRCSQEMQRRLYWLISIVVRGRNEISTAPSVLRACLLQALVQDA